MQSLRKVLDGLLLDPKWEFEVQYPTKEEMPEEDAGSLAAIDLNSSYFKACIKFHPALMEIEDVENFKKIGMACIVHESIHVVLAPLTDVLIANCYGDEAKEMEAIRAEEQVTSHLEKLFMLSYSPEKK